MDTKEIQEAMNYFSPCNEYGFGEPKLGNYRKYMPILLSLATQYLKVEGLPEKVNADFSEWENVGFNKAIDLCRLVIARDYVKRSELPSEEEL